MARFFSDSTNQHTHDAQEQSPENQIIYAETAAISDLTDLINANPFSSTILEGIGKHGYVEALLSNTPPGSIHLIDFEAPSSEMQQAILNQYYSSSVSSGHSLFSSQPSIAPAAPVEESGITQIDAIDDTEMAIDESSQEDEPTPSFWFV